MIPVIRIYVVALRNYYAEKSPLHFSCLCNMLVAIMTLAQLHRLLASDVSCKKISFLGISPQKNVCIVTCVVPLKCTCHLKVIAKNTYTSVRKRTSAEVEFYAN